jgi:hypothetical protein
MVNEWAEVFVASPNGTKGFGADEKQKYLGQRGPSAS